MNRLLVIRLAVLLCALVSVPACPKQGEGERCQVDNDCQSPLVCNRAKNTCQSTTGGDLDASVIDAGPADAAVDAAVDAALDAALDAASGPQ